MVNMGSLKRSRGQEEVEGAELLLLLSLSCGPKTPASSKAKAKAAEEGEFKCKTCSRRFVTFQALGGHRTSHKRPRVERPAAGKESGTGSHRCGVCGVEFALGQALGGHMRRHRVLAAAAADVEERPVAGEFGRGDEVKKSNVCCIEFDKLAGRSSSQCQLLPLFV
ncbi:zinc finger protein ZAT12-like [Zingiber officinale]|uniref:zinc finger protein ZAT12-like n=1 Tax=Zingiber officinale TaxID=94328 RepID=UPI001C4C2956|nr:zinc finger protein ZAT12-like [Zingiber officinale]